MADNSQSNPLTTRNFSKVIISLENILLPKEKLSPTPSELDGLEPDIEIQLRVLGCELIQTSGILLKLPQVAMATGQILFQRFYYSKSFVRHNFEVVAMACINLASKIEEEPRRIRDVINVFHHIKQVKEGKSIEPMILDQTYVNLKTQVIKAERRVLKELGFCVHVQHPHKSNLKRSAKALKLLFSDSDDVRNYMNDSLRTNLWLRYKPESISCACIFLASRNMQVPLPNSPPWYRVFGATDAEVEDIALTILNLYELKRMTADFLEEKVNAVKAIIAEAKMKAKLSNLAVNGTNDVIATPPSAVNSSPEKKETPKQNGTNTSDKSDHSDKPVKEDSEKEKTKPLEEERKPKKRNYHSHLDHLMLDDANRPEENGMMGVTRKADIVVIPIRDLLQEVLSPRAITTVAGIRQFLVEVMFHSLRSAIKVKSIVIIEATANMSTARIPAINLPCGMKLAAPFFGKERETFSSCKDLPPLPIPPLKHTMERYLDSVKPFLNSSEFEKTSRLVKEFESGVGQELNLKLHERAKYQKNWLEKWWEDVAYLESRMPIAPFVNTCGPGAFADASFASSVEGQIPRAGLALWYCLQFWKLLKKEALTVDRDSEGNPFCMNQFYRLFNSCRTPHKNIDKINVHFKSETEGFSPTHLTIICKGRIFTVQVIDESGEPFNVPELEQQMQKVRNYCDSRPWGSSIGALTSMDRDEWANLRKHLIDLDRANEDHLKVIETSVMNMVLDEKEPNDLSEVSLEAIGGDCRNRFFDKSTSMIFFKNGKNCLNNDHAPMDAMTFIVMANFSNISHALNGGKWIGTKTIRKDLPEPKELEFTTDRKIENSIKKAIDDFDEACNNIDLKSVIFEEFGKTELRKYKLHPDTVVQLALQLAYYKMTKKPAPTYETATTRKFYHGRTETIRSCTAEALEFSKSFVNGQHNAQHLRKLLMNAMNKHNQLRIEAQNNSGCDRHLFGLALIARENNLPLPDLYFDEAFIRSGGNGNYKLSTSFVGYTPIYGGVAPMCENGYGCFYSMTGNR
ncbi:DgyrCDS1474 [Dimorphilus gyrociliatus]|uniref:Peroxisomal carnitine O-octanoyltransferase n=1 Tax=Dimorphilus gyrociliatus TaxID=2664684 RepID=A0A7I8V9J5_9ANNE|nr:DgyrCDS1474 [Dimorphilus gyrociliatus]